MSPFFQLILLTILVTLAVEKLCKKLFFAQKVPKTASVEVQTDPETVTPPVPQPMSRLYIETEPYVICKTGASYHKPSCYHVVNRRTSTYRPCLDCVGRRIWVENY